MAGNLELAQFDPRFYGKEALKEASGNAANQRSSMLWRGYALASDLLAQAKLATTSRPMNSHEACWIVSSDYLKQVAGATRWQQGQDESLFASKPPGHTYLKLPISRPFKALSDALAAK